MLFAFRSHEVFWYTCITGWSSDIAILSLLKLGILGEVLIRAPPQAGRSLEKNKETK